MAENKNSSILNAGINELENHTHQYLKESHYDLNPVYLNPKPAVYKSTLTIDSIHFLRNSTNRRLSLASSSFTTTKLSPGYLAS